MIEGLKLYDLTEIMKMEWKDSRTIKKSFRYIPVKIKNAQTVYRERTWRSNKDYTVKYILFSDLKDWFLNNHWKRLSFLDF